MMTSKELREMSTEDFAMIDQVTLLSFVNDKELEIAILLAAFGPLRRSEICALTSSDIDGNFIRIEEAVVINKNREWITKQPKTFASYRRIEMPEFVIRKMQGIEGKIIKCTPNALTARFIKARNRSGRPHFRFHDLRHPYVKHMTKIFSLRLMDSQAQAYPDARRKTRGACQLHRGGQNRSSVRPLCNRKRFS